MKTKITQYIAIAILLGSSCLYARIGESLEQCEERYGKAQFQNPKGDYEYRSYNLNGKRIQIVFYKAISTQEIMTIGPKQLFETEQIRKFISDGNEFIRGLLKTAYGYSDEELEKLNPLKRVNQRKFQSGVAEKGDLRASWWIKANDKEDQMTLACPRTLIHSL